MWAQKETFDGTYNLDDLLDAHEIMQVTRENEKRSFEASRRREV